MNAKACVYQFMLLIQPLHHIFHLFLMFFPYRLQSVESRLLFLSLLLQLFLKLFCAL